MEAYSLDLRKRVLAACDAGRPTKVAAEMFGVSTAWVRRLKQRRRELNIIDRLPANAGRKSKLTEADLRRLAELVAAQPDATLLELRDRLGVPVAPSSICRALRRLGLSFKKRRSTQPSRTAPTSKPNAAAGTDSSSR